MMFFRIGRSSLKAVTLALGLVLAGCGAAAGSDTSTTATGAAVPSGESSPTTASALASPSAVATTAGTARSPRAPAQTEATGALPAISGLSLDYSTIPQHKTPEGY